MTEVVVFARCGRCGATLTTEVGAVNISVPPGWVLLDFGTRTEWRCPAHPPAVPGTNHDNPAQ